MNHNPGNIMKILKLPPYTTKDAYSSMSDENVQLLKFDFFSQNPDFRTSQENSHQWTCPFISDKTDQAHNSLIMWWIFDHFLFSGTITSVSTSPLWMWRSSWRRLSTLIPNRRPQYWQTCFFSPLCTKRTWSSIPSLRLKTFWQIGQLAGPLCNK